MTMTLNDLGGGRWIARAYVGRDPATGRKVRPSHTFRAGGADEAEAEALRWYATVEPRRAGVPATLSAMLSWWVDDLEARGCRGNSVAAYRQAARRVGRTPLGSMPMASVTSADVVAAMEQLEASGSVGGGPLSAATVKQTVNTLSRAYGDWMSLGWVDGNPARGARFRAASQPSPRARSLGEMDAAATLRALNAAVSAGEPGTADHSSAASVRLVMLAGLRMSEALALEVGDYRSSTGTVSVSVTLVTKPRLRRQEMTKTAAGRRSAAVPEAAGLAEIAAARVAAGAGAGDPMFPGKGGLWLRPDAVWSWFAAFRSAEGLPPWATPHVLRHTFASFAIAGGESPVSVKSQLGHASWTTTLACYSHEIEGRRENLSETVGTMYEEAMGLWAQ